jgi:hypothetical protein
MSHSDFFTALRSTDYDFIAALRFLDDYVRRSAGSHSHGHFSSSDEEAHRQFVPRFDLEEHGDRYEIYGELPGVRKENVNVEANDDRNIVISGWLTRMASKPAVGEEPLLSSKRGEDGESKAEDGRDFVEVKHTDTVSSPPSYQSWLQNKDLTTLRNLHLIPSTTQERPYLQQPTPIRSQKQLDSATC